MTSPRVLLVNPAEPGEPLAYLPLSLIGIAEVLRRDGVHVEILDARLDDLPVHETIRRIRSGDYDVVGITGLNKSYRYIKDLAFEFKRHFPAKPLVAGGTFIAAEPRIILEKVPFDAACIGEGEPIVVELVRRLAAGASLEGLQGIAFMRNGVYVETERVYCDDMESLPFPAYDLLDMPRYLRKIETLKIDREHFIPINTGRGCVYHCYYCGRRGVGVRRTSPRRLLEHMDLLHERYGIKAFMFSEDNPLHPREWILEFLGLVKDSGRPYKLAMSGCPDQMDDEIIGRVAELGVDMSYTIEHLDPEIQKGFHRVKQSKHIIRAMELLKKHRVVNASFNMLWGHPKDTAARFRAAFRDAMNLMYKYDIHYIAAVGLCVYQNSRMFQDARQMGKIVDYEDHMYASDGFGPYVNLTAENDDVYRTFIAELYQLGMLKILAGAVQFHRLASTEDGGERLEYWTKRFTMSMERLRFLQGLYTMPDEERARRRAEIEDCLPCAMYDPGRNYYREIACLAELLDLPRGTRLVAFGAGSLAPRNTARLFNSVREGGLVLEGFAELEATAGRHEGLPLKPLRDWTASAPGAIVTWETHPGLERARDESARLFPGTPFLVVSAATLDPPRRFSGVHLATFANEKYWEVHVKDGKMSWEACYDRY